MSLSITPFIYITTQRVVVCAQCQHGVVANEAATHLASKHKVMPAETRAQVAKNVQRIRGVIRTQDDLDSFRFPPPEWSAHPHLQTPRTDGLGCHQCTFVSPHRRIIQQHYADEHDWVNLRGKGRINASRAERLEAVPWRTGVRCQRYFISRKASGWFEVERRRAPVQEEGPVETRKDQMIQVFQRQVEMCEEAGKQEVVEEVDAKTEPNKWLDRVGWAQHLDGFEVDEIVG
jgi:hypothetical protein